MTVNWKQFHESESSTDQETEPSDPIEDDTEEKLDTKESSEEDADPELEQKDNPDSENKIHKQAKALAEKRSRCGGSATTKENVSVHLAGWPGSCHRGVVWVSRHNKAIGSRQNQIDQLATAQAKLNEKRLQGEFANRQMGEYVLRSLPGDPSAQSQHQQWLSGSRQRSNRDAGRCK